VPLLAVVCIGAERRRCNRVQTGLYVCPFALSTTTTTTTAAAAAAAAVLLGGGVAMSPVTTRRRQFRPIVIHVDALRQLPIMLQYMQFTVDYTLASRFQSPSQEVLLLFTTRAAAWYIHSGPKSENRSLF